MERATLWYIRDQKTGTFQYNHLESGTWNPNHRPTPKHEQQNYWKRVRWTKELVYVDENNKVIHSDQIDFKIDEVAA